LRQDSASHKNRATSKAISYDVTRVFFNHEYFWSDEVIIVTDDQFQSSQKQSES